MPDTARALADAITALYRMPGKAVGCCLHSVTDDGNVETASVAWCLDRALERGHAECAALAERLLAASRTQRVKAIGMSSAQQCAELHAIQAQAGRRWAQEMANRIDAAALAMLRRDLNLP